MEEGKVPSIDFFCTSHVSDRLFPLLRYFPSAWELIQFASVCTHYRHNPKERALSLACAVLHILFNRNESSYRLKTASLCILRSHAHVMGLSFLQFLALHKRRPLSFYIHKVLLSTWINSKY